MSRAADYTIQGFLYQFNKTALEILNASPDSLITVEGIVEDIEITTPSITNAIQCKYHEASETFTPSSIYKPVLQMMNHYHANQTANMRYTLFAHFPSVKGKPQPILGQLEMQAALDSQNKDLQSLIAPLKGKVDVDAFLKRFTMEFGQAFDDLAKRVGNALKANGIPQSEIDTLGYPNAIHIISGMSVKHDPTERNITNRQFVDRLKAIRTTAISRWTLALKTHKKLLESRQKQLKSNLDKNARLRYFVIDAKSLEDYDNGIVLFIKDYLEKYHVKPAHTETPVICLCTAVGDVPSVVQRLYAKNILATDGCVGGIFEERSFFRAPITQRPHSGPVKREFSVRVLRWEDHGAVLNNVKCDDLFIIGEPSCDLLNTIDVNVEYLAATTLQEIKFLLGVSNVYE
jgi:hypothetical protein